VVEADTKKGHAVDGIASLRALEAQHGALPLTLMAQSPSGSLHHYFRHPAGSAIRTSTSKLAPGVDVRGDGGMVLAPPSLRPGIGSYTWANNAEGADAPPWPTELVTRENEGEHVVNEKLIAEDMGELAAAVAVIPNPAELGWDGWNRHAMAIYGATGGSEEGFAIFDQFSHRWEGKYDAEATRARWEALRTSPPGRIGAGTLFYLADQADPRWRERHADDVVRAIQLNGGGGFDGGGSFVSVETGRVYGPNGHAKPGPQPGPQPGPTAVNILGTPYQFRAEADIVPWQWLYGRHLLRGEVSGTAAMGGTGKSTKSIVEALAMASGRTLLGSNVPAPVRVVLVNLEDTRNTMDKRIAAVMRYHGLTAADIGDRLIVLAKGEVKIKVARQLRSGDVERNEPTIRALIRLMIEHHADVLSIDSLIRTHKVNENDNSAMQEVVECFEDIAQEAQCAVHLWHHTRKMGGEHATIESARGAIAFIDACRSARILETMHAKQHEDLL